MRFVFMRHTSKFACQPSMQKPELTDHVSGQMEKHETKQPSRPMVPPTPQYMAPTRASPLQSQSEDVQAKIWARVFTFYNATDYIEWPCPNELPTYPTRLMLVCKLWRVGQERQSRCRR